MKRLCIALIGLAQALAVEGHADGQATNAVQNRFKYELFTAQSGALHGAAKGNTHANDLVHAVFVDSKGRVWVGTRNGLAVYDGKQWTNRTFKIRGPSWSERAVLGLMSISVCGQEKIAEGPPGTIWLGGSGCGVWRFRDGRYEEIASSPAGSSYLGMAVDRTGSLWVVCKQFVHKYEGRSWTTVLCPYVGKPASVEPPGLYGIAIDAQGSVWIGATVYGEPEAPWEHDGPFWVVDQARKKRGDGPPMAPLFAFDGKLWRAFGSPHGLGLRKHEGAIPELDGQGRVVAKTPKGYYLREGETWRPSQGVDLSAGKSWVIRERRRGVLPGYAELLFREGDRLVEVQPIDHKTGEALDFGSEQFVALRMAEDRGRGCVWLGTMHGLYRIWPEKSEQ